ncbi:hypothetical protein EGH21_22465 [Halomicroarcula sp. F13]|uniref:Zinc finger FPG/IleRS-type domain-containing protein n=1 Tax=Haloarcula rubra TaxID=2487747 RepID=A0AAW4PZA3_9EURY|nr:zinc finger domain-containing protein [Halomicroarcula rubra]MBX0325785.1 hypothetical protein [Halomicroarcula rubra]
MPSECEQCGVTSRGAVVREFGDEMLCVDCAAPGECKRCGAKTSELTLAGDWLCGRCQDQRQDQQKCREASQHGLGRFADG